MEQNIHRLLNFKNEHTQTAVPPRCLLNGKVQIENYKNNVTTYSQLEFPLLNSLCSSFKTLDVFTLGLFYDFHKKKHHLNSKWMLFSVSSD